MKHYDYIEWVLYKNKALPTGMLEEMEEHLYNCDICMDIFLSLIDQQEVESTEGVIPNDFKDKVINNISSAKVRIIESKQKHKNRVFNYQFGSYVAVASVTIILTLGGFYTNLVDAVPKIGEAIKIVEYRPNLIANFSNTIVNSTSSLLLSIENIDRFKEGK